MKKNLIYLRSRISTRNLLLLSSVAIGALAGAVAVVLKRLVHFFHTLTKSGFISEDDKWFLFVYPFTGILLTVVYIHVFHKGKIGKGLNSVLISIERSGRVAKHKMYSHLVSSALTVGFGGSAGLEAPIVVTGSAIGSNTGTFFGFSGKERILLLACGASAGIAAVFNSPIAGVIFSVEVLLAEFSIPAFVPLLLAAATAAVISNLFYSERLFFLITNGWEMSAIPYYVLLGIVLGLLSVYVTRLIELMEKAFEKQKSVVFKFLVGATLLGILIVLIPPLYGEGYDTIKALLRGDNAYLVKNSIFSGKGNDTLIIAALATGMALIKIIATELTKGAGGNGGIFAPSLFIGASSGFVYSYLVNLSGLTSLIVPNFIVAGMAAAISGIIHAPLTGVFLIAEITGGYSLFVPLMVASALSFFIARFFEPYSIYKKHLIRKGYLAANKDESLLGTIPLRNLIEKDFVVLHEDDLLRDVVKAFGKSKRNIFPVTDTEQRLQGVVSLDNIRDLMFNTDRYDKTRVKDLMEYPAEVISKEENLRAVMRKFDESNTWNLPVVQDGKYVGFISKSQVFNKYRELLQSEDPL